VTNVLFSKVKLLITLKSQNLRTNKFVEDIRNINATTETNLTWLRYAVYEAFVNI